MEACLSCVRVWYGVLRTVHTRNFDEKAPPFEHIKSAWLCPSLFKLEIDRLSGSLNQSNPGSKYILIIDDNRLQKTSLDSTFENLEVVFLQANVGEKEPVTPFKMPLRNVLHSIVVGLILVDQ